MDFQVYCSKGPCQGLKGASGASPRVLLSGFALGGCSGEGFPGRFFEGVNSPNLVLAVHEQPP